VPFKIDGLLSCLQQVDASEYLHRDFRSEPGSLLSSSSKGVVGDEPSNYSPHATLHDRQYVQKRLAIRMWGFSTTKLSIDPTQCSGHPAPAAINKEKEQKSLGKPRVPAAPAETGRGHPMLCSPLRYRQT